MSQKKNIEKCPKCESDLHYVEKVGQHYCYSCENYLAPEETPIEKEEVIKEEKKEIERITEVPPIEEKKEPVEEEKNLKETDKTICPSCGDTATLREDTKRYYCNSCEDYIDAEEKKVEESKEDEKTATLEETPAIAEEMTVESPQEVVTEKVDEMPKAGAPPEEILKEAFLREESRTCEDCGADLMYVQKYDRWYCKSCRKYAPTDDGSHICPTCGGDTKFIEKYERWYCWNCKEYLPVEEKAQEIKTKEETPNCPDCGKPTTWIDQYKRFYCYPCKKYITKEKKDEKKKPAGPSCPDCGRTTTWIPTYERFYCYPCKKYVMTGESKTVPERQTKRPGKTEQSAPLCKECGKPTKWIAKYERYYCYPCKKYVLKNAKK